MRRILQKKTQGKQLQIPPYYHADIFKKFVENIFDKIFYEHLPHVRTKYSTVVPMI